jgi:hypothetical protein
MQMGNTRSTLRAVTNYLLIRYQLITPEGCFDVDNLWHPSARNTAICCAKVRRPDELNPYTLMRHCRSATHMYHVYDLSCSLVEFRGICRHASAMYVSCVAISEVGVVLRKLCRTVATDSCLEAAPQYAVESVMLES